MCHFGCWPAAFMGNPAHGLFGVMAVASLGDEDLLFAKLCSYPIERFIALSIVPSTGLKQPELFLARFG